MARRLLLLLALCVLPSLAHGQGVTTASMSGAVVDAADEPLPGANVIAVHEPTGTQYGTSTNLEGTYKIINMRPGGPYTVRVSFIGYQTQTQQDLNLKLGETRVLNFLLEEAAGELEGIEVVGTASTVLNSERTGASTNLSEETIERMPTISRSLADFARLAPQSTGGSSVAGRNNRYNNIQIDGATMNDVFGLSGTGAPGGQAGAQPISLDAIQEFNVDIAPYDVRYGGFTGAQVNAVTRSGSNSFTGSVYYLGRDEGFVGDLEGDDGELTDYPEFNESFAGFRLGGPIIKNKLFFFVNAEMRRRNDPLSTGLAGSSAANIFEVEPAVLDEIVGIAENEYGYDPGGYDLLTTDEDNYKVFARLDWNINQNNRLTLRHNFVDAADDDGIARSPDEFSLSNRLYVFRSNVNSSVAQLNTTLGATAFNEARLVYSRIRDERDVQASAFPEVTINVGGGDEVALGIDRYSQANALDQDLIEFTDNFTWLRGDHTFTFGTNTQLWRFSNLFLRDYYGSYEFDSIDDFRQGAPSFYALTYPAPGFPEQPRAEFSAYQVGLYAQDEYAVMPNLQLTFGLRMDVPFFPDEPPANPDAVDAFGVATTNTASGNVMWSPRLGFNYALTQERNTQLRGGTGIFSGRTPYVWISNQYSTSGVDVLRTQAYDLPPGFFVPSADPADQPRPGGDNALQAEESTEVNLIDEDFTFPQVWRTNLAIDQQLPYGLVATFEGLYSKSLNEVTYENLNLDRTGTSAFGRPIYGSTSGFTGEPARIDDRFTDAIFLTNTDEGYEYSLTGQLQKSTDVGLDARLSYTYNRSENLNNATSSQARSNWIYNEAVDINDPGLATADFEVRHRILGVVSQRVEWLDRFATTASLVYEGRSGSPFTWIYTGDANADGENYNDPVYVPADQGDVEIVETYRGALGSWETLDRFISEFESLDDLRGEIAERNTARAPWRHILDLRLSQEIETIDGQRIELTANVFNVLNLINNDWGQIQYVNYSTVNAWNFEGYTEDGRPQISFDDEDLQEYIDDESELFRTSELASRWQIQLGVRYTF